jgi:hypothetical protein
MAFVAGYAGYAQFYREFFRGLKISPIQERPSRKDPSQRSPKESGASSRPSAKKSAARFRGSRPAGNYSGRSRDFNNWPCRTEIRRRPAIQPISRTLLTPMKNDREYSMPKATLWAKVSAVVHVFIVFLGVVVGRESRDRGPGMRCDAIGILVSPVFKGDRYAKVERRATAPHLPDRTPDLNWSMSGSSFRSSPLFKIIAAP